MENRRDQVNVEDEVSRKLERMLRDPLRAWILAQLNDAPAAAVDLAKKAKEPRNKVHYHVDQLLKADFIEQVDEVRVRGTYKKIYKAKVKVLIPLEVWEQMAVGPRNGISLKIFGETVERIQAALESGTFDSKVDRVAANYKPRLDDEGWKKAIKIMHRAHHEIEDLEGEAIARHPDHLDRKPVTVHLYCYPSPPGR